jgi:hypothetical protein
VAPLDPSTFLQVVLPVASAGVAGGAAFGVVRRVRAGDAYTGLGRPFAGVAAAFAALAVTYALFGSLDADASELVTLVVFVVAGPWFVFALRYAGRGHVLRRRWVVVGGVALLVGALGDMWLSFPETVALPVSGDLFTPVFGLLVLLPRRGVTSGSRWVTAWSQCSRLSNRCSCSSCCTRGRRWSTTCSWRGCSSLPPSSVSSAPAGTGSSTTRRVSNTAANASG